MTSMPRLFFILALVVASTAPGYAQGCAERIAFVQKVIDSDRKINFIGKDVYAQMDADLKAASVACAAGDSGKANAIITASQSRHGYPVR